MSALIRLREIRYESARSLLDDVAKKAAAGLYGSTQEQKVANLVRDLHNGEDSIEVHLRKFVTQDPDMLQVKARIRLLQPRPEPVLITGPTGTGKELLAQALKKPGEPFVAENCAALPENLVESIFFGHRKGAFTGASEDHMGLLEEAGEGIIFLDEIGDLSLPLQAKFLRAIQEGEIRRVGSTKTITLDCRFVAATKYNLEERVAAKLFREDLYARLFTFDVHVTGLIDRKPDIELILKSMINAPEKYGADFTEKDAMPLIGEKELELIYRYNVRAIEAILARWRAYNSYL